MVHNIVRLRPFWLSEGSGSRWLRIPTPRAATSSAPKIHRPNSVYASLSTARATAGGGAHHLSSDAHPSSRDTAAPVRGTLTGRERVSCSLPPHRLVIRATGSILGWLPGLIPTLGFHTSSVTHRAHGREPPPTTPVNAPPTMSAMPRLGRRSRRPGSIADHKHSHGPATTPHHRGPAIERVLPHNRTPPRGEPQRSCAQWSMPHFRRAAAAFSLSRDHFDDEHQPWHQGHRHHADRPRDPPIDTNPPRHGRSRPRPTQHFCGGTSRTSCSHDPAHEPSLPSTWRQTTEPPASPSASPPASENAAPTRNVCRTPTPSPLDRPRRTRESRQPAQPDRSVRRRQTPRRMPTRPQRREPLPHGSPAGVRITPANVLLPTDQRK